MTNFEEYHQSRLEDSGLISPHEVNQMEKNEYQKYHDNKLKQRTNQKIKNDEPISFADLSWGQTLLQSLDNVPEGLEKYVTAIYDIVRHPIISGKALAGMAKDIAIGTVQTGVARMYSQGLDVPYRRDVLTDKPTYSIDPEKYPEMAAIEKIETDLYRLGTEEGLKEYIANNPIDALANISELFIPLAKTIGVTGKLPRVAKTLEKIGTSAEPIVLGGKVIKLPFSALMNMPLVRRIPEGLYGRALNLGKWLNDKQVDKLIKFGMKGGVPVKFKELERLNDYATQINDLITKLISDLDPEKYKIHRYELLKGMDEFSKKKGLGSRGMADVDVINRRIKSVLEGEEQFRGSEHLTPLEVQRKKIDFNKELNKTFQEGLQKNLDTTVDNETAMLMAKNMRNAIETMIPEVKLIDIPKKLNNKVVQKFWPGTKKLSAKELNELEGSIINLMNAIGQEARKKRYGDIMSFQVGQKMATIGVGGTIVSKALNLGQAAELVSYAALASGITLGVIDSSPAIKSAVALYLRNLRRFGIDTKPTGAIIRLGLYEAAKPGREELMQAH